MLLSIQDDPCKSESKRERFLLLSVTQGNRVNGRRVLRRVAQVQGDLHELALPPGPNRRLTEQADCAKSPPQRAKRVGR